MRLAALITGIVAVSVAIFFLPIKEVYFALAPHSVTTSDNPPLRLLFTGDIMMGRAVEIRMEGRGSNYPFLGTQALLTKPDLTIGNFEAASPNVHVRTPSMGMQLSAKQSSFIVLADNGFDILGLANNHTFDFGADGFLNTKDSCRDAELVCVGHPNVPQERVVTQKGVRIGLLALNDISVPLDVTAAKAALVRLEHESDIQIAYMHWGEEYEPIHTPRQESIAHSLIESGADVIVGMHPHIVQDIEIYNGRAIFYSLGNFVFDQDFSRETQEGLLLELTVSEKDITFTLIPITSVA